MLRIAASDPANRNAIKSDAFDFIVPHIMTNEHAHVLACRVESALNLCRTPPIGATV